MDSVKLVLPHTPYFPSSLSQLSPPPLFLFAMGNLSLIKDFSVAVVGARACSDESIYFTKQFVTELCRRNIVILSGMANGIDQIAHETCIEQGGKTIAIIGSGFHAAQKRPLFRSILEHNGLILSEYFPDTPVQRYHFPRRNQLIVAIAKGVLAMEVHLESGTMITANEAILQGKPLFTIPGNPLEERWKGNNYLLSQGAYCVYSYQDIFSKLSSLYPTYNWEITPTPPSTITIPPAYAKIYTALCREPSNINQLAHQLSLPLKELQSSLTLMEIDNYIERIQNRYYPKQ